MMIEIKITDDGKIKLNMHDPGVDLLQKVLVLPIVALDILVKKLDVPAASAGNMLIEAIQKRLKDLAEEKK